MRYIVTFIQNNTKVQQNSLHKEVFELEYFII